MTWFNDGDKNTKLFHAHVTWFNDGDKNTKLFHAHVNGKRKRLQLKRIQNNAGQWVEDTERIADEAVRFFQAQFHEDVVATEFQIINHVPQMVNGEKNQELLKQPTREEVKQAVYGLNGDNCGGPDGFNGSFFHSCWDIVGDDMVEMVKAFFNGQELPRFITHTNLVLLPKKKEVLNFSDMRPISLSNFINKVFSRVIHERLVGLLPTLISDEQAGFVKGRSIVENILLTQEIITDIRLRTKAGPNVPHGFFKSTRGVKQGDPLSPTLFILAAEAMSRGLNSLHYNLYFCGFGFPKWSPKIKHLAYADDTIIFSSSDATSLQLIMQVLTAYEAASGKLINKAKSAIYMHHLIDEDVVRKLERVTGIGRQDFPFTYLRCPIFYARRKMDYYQGMIKKMIDKLQSWKGKLLSIGGRAVLISHVIQSMPIHLLSAVKAPASVINKLHKLMGRFFWSSSIEGGHRHWASWDTLCLPVEEGGVGFRSLHDVSKALFCMLWWNFRTKPSLWSSFMSQKYCKKLNPIVVPWRKGSHIWRKMLQCRDDIEHQILWQPKMGSSLFWFENWTGLGALYFVTPPDFFCNESIQNVNEVVQGGRWIMQLLPADLATHILQNIKPPGENIVLDRPFWMLETRGEFSVRSAWEYVRRRKEPCNAYKMIWIKGLPFKVSFFMWKYFLPAAGIKVEGLTFHQANVKCWTAKVIPRLQPIIQALPSIIVWELWKRRNSYKYGDAVSMNKVIYQVSTTLQHLVKCRKPSLQNVPHKWPDLIDMMEQFTPKLKYTKVMWEYPNQGWVKVNTDATCRGNPGRSSIGFVLRNEEGNVLYACGKEMEEGTNTEAEVQAILEALRYCVTHDYILIDLHTDSMLVKNVILGDWNSPRSVVVYMEEIKELMNRCNLKVSHTLREGNQLADHIANYALDTGPMECNGFGDLDVQGRKIVNSDKLQCPYLRVKVARN
ncbi:PREDICTED: uncharacterized protein LOC109230201 [Nicotiana attenuata]|uniref:uncharacterized protein LOC109230201 n=1 Tax=Nicotiana attenuata TaxID=49451 RepID=UPI000904DD16|nr:PREDICTED: uncharacterized protein LOC109230201 [Nicotiana attenuata]